MDMASGEECKGICTNTFRKVDELKGYQEERDVNLSLTS